MLAIFCSRFVQATCPVSIPDHIASNFKRAALTADTVIAHVDHGKSTLTDSLLVKAGIVASARGGDARAMDTRADEQERGITIKSTAISMYFEMPKDDLPAIKQKTEGGSYAYDILLTLY